MYRCREFSERYRRRPTPQISKQLRLANSSNNKSRKLTTSSSSNSRTVEVIYIYI